MPQTVNFERSKSDEKRSKVARKSKNKQETNQNNDQIEEPFWNLSGTANKQ